MNISTLSLAELSKTRKNNTRFIFTLGKTQEKI